MGAAQMKIDRLPFPEGRPSATELIRQSVPGRSIYKGMRRAEAAAEQSLAVGSMRAAADAWRGLPGSARLRALAVMLLVAAGTHIVMTLLHQTPAGWMWLVVPVIAVAQAIVLLIAGSESSSLP